MTAHFFKWSTVVAAGMTAGWGIGWATDGLLGVLSWHYVYPPDHAVCHGRKFGLWAGALLAAGAVVGCRRPASWRQVGLALIGVAACVIAGATVGSGIGFAIASSGLHAPATPIPLRRLLVTQGLLWGEGCAAVVGVLVTTWFLWRSRT